MSILRSMGLLQRRSFATGKYADLLGKHMDYRCGTFFLKDLSNMNDFVSAYLGCSGMTRGIPGMQAMNLLYNPKDGKCLTTGIFESASHAMMFPTAPQYKEAFVTVKDFIDIDKGIDISFGVAAVEVVNKMPNDGEIACVRATMIEYESMEQMLAALQFGLGMMSKFADAPGLMAVSWTANPSKLQSTTFTTWESDEAGEAWAESAVRKGLMADLAPMMKTVTPVSGLRLVRMMKLVE